MNTDSSNPNEKQEGSAIDGQQRSNNSRSSRRKTYRRKTSPKRQPAKSSKSAGSLLWSMYRKDTRSSSDNFSSSGSVNSSDSVDSINSNNTSDGSSSRSNHGEDTYVAGVVQENQQLFTKNDYNNILTALTEAIRDQKQGRWRDPKYHTPKLNPLIDKLRDKLITTNSIILPAILKSQLAQVLSPIRAKAEALGDTYFQKAMQDIENGRVDRLERFMWLSGINQVRLMLAKDPMFRDINTYIMKTYGSDPTNPKHATFFIPAEEDSVRLEETWKRIHDLEKEGLIVKRGDIEFKLSNETHKLVILTIADAVE